MISRIASELIPFLFSMGAGYFAGRVKQGAMPLSSINTMLVDYALPFALFLYTARMQRASLAQHGVLIAVLVGVMLVPYFASLLVSRFVFKSDPATAAVRAVTIGMPNFASVGLPLLRAVYGPESDLTAGLALFSTGLVLAAQPFRFDAQAGFGIVLSNIVQPLIALTLVNLLAVPKAIAGQAILLAAIPCGSFGILFGLPYGVSDASAGTTLVASSLLSAVTLSGTIVLLGHP